MAIIYTSPFVDRSGNFSIKMADRNNSWILPCLQWIGLFVIYCFIYLWRSPPELQSICIRKLPFRWHQNFHHWPHSSPPPPPRPRRYVKTKPGYCERITGLMLALSKSGSPMQIPKTESCYNTDKYVSHINIYINIYIPSEPVTLPNFNIAWKHTTQNNKWWFRKIQVHPQKFYHFF